MAAGGRGSPQGGRLQAAGGVLPFLARRGRVLEAGASQTLQRILHIPCQVTVTVLLKLAWSRCHIAPCISSVSSACRGVHVSGVLCLDAACLTHS